MKRQTQTILCVIMLLSEFSSAQVSSPQHVWVFFQKKDTDSLQAIGPAALGISERALKRRAKTLPQDRLIDEYDLPVSQTALAQVKQTGAKIRTVSRWLNAASIEATPHQLQILETLPIITSLEPIISMSRSEPLPSPATSTLSLRKTSESTGLDYGLSATQLTNSKIIDLHALGVNGTGVLIGMLDDGFNNYRIHPALKNIKVDSTFDFIHNIVDVNHQQWENPVQGNHGAGTLSAIGGFENGYMIGSAYGASFLLAKTEMDSSGNNYDFHSEEDTYVAGLEWAERLGADITSSSLGYKEFWSSPTYTTADLNGRTTKVAKAAVIAARKGVLVVTAMGNEGSSINSTLLSPADADSIIAVGAAYADGTLTYFSSTGPTADGRIKPEVVAQGYEVFWANGDTSGFEFAPGTSCSTPLVAGAAALVLSAHPELSNMQIRNAILCTATKTLNPDNFYGYGFINAYDAALYYGPIFGNTYPEKYNLYQNYPNPFNTSTTIVCEVPKATDIELTVFNILGQNVRAIFHGLVQTVCIKQWDGTDDLKHQVATGVYFVRMKTPDIVISKKILYLK